MDTRDIVDRLGRIEGKLDKHLEKLAGAEADIRWIKKALSVGGIVLLGVIGKLAHITFFKP